MFSEEEKEEFRQLAAEPAQFDWKGYITKGGYVSGGKTLTSGTTAPLTPTERVRIMDSIKNRFLRKST